MPSSDAAFGLRLAAKASDRAKAAEQKRPAFEERLRQLGYALRAIARVAADVQRNTRTSTSCRQRASKRVGGDARIRWQDDDDRW